MRANDCSMLTRCEHPPKANSFSNQKNSTGLVLLPSLDREANREFEKLLSQGHTPVRGGTSTQTK